MKKEAWEKFKNTGSVDDYLHYKKRQKNYLNELGTEVIIRNKGDNHDRNNRRGRS